MTNVLSFADARAKREATTRPTWADNLRIACAYARSLRADHAAECAAVDLQAAMRGFASWGMDDALIARIDENNITWDIYRGVIEDIAQRPAATRSEATLKRTTIGRMWLRCEGDWYDRLREGCARDDHLFPPSERIAKAA